MMDINELMRAVQVEGLDTPVLYGHGAFHDNAVVIEGAGTGFRVYLVNERAGIIESTLRIFDNEPEALDHVLLKLRQVAKSRRTMALLRERRQGNRQSD